MDFKNIVHQRRMELHMTMEDLAKRIGVSTPTIQRYESGEIKNVRRDKIKLLADALQCSPAYLMDWTDSVTDASDQLLSKLDLNTIRQLNDSAINRLNSHSRSLLHMQNKK